MQKNGINTNQYPVSVPDGQPLWSYKETAAYFQVSEDKLRHDMSAGKIPDYLFVRPFGGRLIRFIPEAIMKYVLEQSRMDGVE